MVEASKDKGLYAGYEDEIRKYRLDFSLTCAYFAIALILLGIGLDYGLYPHMQYLFGAVRVFVSVLLYGVILALRTQWGQDKTELLSFVWLLLPQLMITWMIGVTEGGASWYSVGLYLAIFASSIALPFSFWHNLVLSSITLILYLIACSLHPQTFVMQGIFVVNALFLVFVIIVSGVAAFFNERVRLILFRLKTELEKKNRQLEETNKSLGEIKGQMLQQEKMAAIGTLSAGLLHEVNNPVNYCLMALDVARENKAAKDDPLLAECLADARQGMQRVQQIVGDLKTFAYRAKDGHSEDNPFQFEKAVDSALRLVGFETRGIEVARDLPADTLVQGDEAAIIGVLVNLLDNAVLAIRNKDYAGSGEAPAIRVSAAWEGGGSG